MCLMFGVMKFMPHKEMPPMPEVAENLMNAMMEAGYFMPTVGVIFIACGLGLVLGRYVPLALILLFPISVNVVFFHLFLDPAGIMMAAVLFVLNAVLLWKYRKAYTALLKPKCCCNHSCDVK